MGAVLLVVLGSALASHGSASLTGSNFEIDANANLKVDDASPSMDWLNDAGTAIRGGVDVQADTPSGKNDSAFGQGTAENQEPPTIKNGSIPPNKSDLTNFGIFNEKSSSGSFLQLFWSRVQEPSGTTNMDFEFNKLYCDVGTGDVDCSSNGVTPDRSVGDLLIEYHLENGGVTATLSLREWTGSAWGSAEALTGKAIGSINSSAIAAGDSGGLGSLSPRTFGEASIDLSQVLSQDRCESFGSAYLKSRSSDSFSSEIKDFIAPKKVSVSNCGSVLVEKVEAGTTTPRLTGATFVVRPGSTDADGTTAAETELTEVADGLYCADDLLFGDVEVEETVAPPGYELPADPTQDFTVTDNGTCDGRVDDGDEPDLTFEDPPSRGAIEITKTAKHKDTSGDTSPNLVAEFTITSDELADPIVVSTDADGKACVDNLAFGDYNVEETDVPAGYEAPADASVTVDNKAACSDTLFGGEQVTMENTPLTNLDITLASQVDGATETVITCKDADGNVVKTVTVSDGTLSIDDLEPQVLDCEINIDP